MPPLDDYHAVDGISGGTITSDGVSDMLLERLNMYLPYITKARMEMNKKLNTDIDPIISINDSILQINI